MQGIKIDSLTVADKGNDVGVRHLFYWQLQNNIELPFYMILMKVVWKKDRPNSMAKIVNGILDLSELI